MHEEPPKKPDDVIDFVQKKKEREESGETRPAAGNYKKKIGWLIRKDRIRKEGFPISVNKEELPEQKSMEGDLKSITLLIAEYQFDFLTKLNFLIPMSKTILNNSGENEFLKETADIRNELYDWEKKLETAYENLQKIAGEKSLLETVRKYLDNFKICGLGQYDVQEDEHEAANLMKKLEDFVERNK
jgi:hypothetical protein